MVKEKICLILLSSTILMATLVLQVSAQSPTINIDPSSIEVNIGEPFTVTINITNVEAPGIFSYELKVYYNNTLLNATAASYPSGHFLPPPNFEVPPEIHNDQGYVVFAVTKLGDVPGSTGSGVLATIQFTGIGVGVSSLELEDVILLDPEGDEVSFSVNNGTVTVVPEFAQLLLILIFSTLAVIALKKFAISKNSRSMIP
jgi:hypothetical protein